MNRTRAIGSLFAGLGGFDLAFEQAGFETQWQVEINKDAKRVLARHWPEVTRYDDITTLDPRDLEPVDVICGGSPCQSFSVAGKREGLDGASGLFWHYVRIADSQPDAVVVWENVPGVLSSDRGRDFQLILWAFTGYLPPVPPRGWRNSGVCIGPKRSVAWRILDAQYAGVPQRRRRIFLVGHPVGRTDCAEILFEPDSLRGDPPTRRQAGTVAPTLTASGAGTGRTGNERTEAEFLVTEALPTACEVSAVDMRNLAENGDISGALQAKSNGGYSLNYINPIMVARTRLGKGNDSRDESLETYVPVAYALRADPGGVGQGHNTNYIVDSVAKTLTANYGKQVDSSDTNAGPPNVIVEQVAPCLRTNPYNNSDPTMEAQMLVTHALTARMDSSEDGTGRGTPLVAASLTTKPYADNEAQESRFVAQSMAVRRLLPVECERLQGLPDEWTRWDADGKELSDSARYRLVGNAVAVPVVRWIAERLKTVMEGGSL